ncbi:unnamed protein product [Brassica oleracea var. botrytis]
MSKGSIFIGGSLIQKQKSGGRTLIAVFEMVCLVNLRRACLDSNNLSGTLPNSISNHKYLRVLSLPGCNLFGKIPSSLRNLSYLTKLDLFENGFTGELPVLIGNLRRQTDLQIAFNSLNGNFPRMLLNLSELTRIIFRSNHFEGMLPSNLSNLSKLVYFDMSGNSFSGPIPSSLFMMSSLTHLALVRNDFSGPLEIGKGVVDFSIFLHLKSLTSLDLSYLNTQSSNNFFGGEIPRTICDMVSLDTLVLSNNHFNSSIPQCFENFNATLSVLHLQNNIISGTFPEETISDHLISLDVGHRLTISYQENFPNYFVYWSAMASVVDIVDRAWSRIAGRGSRYHHNSVDLTYKGLKMDKLCHHKDERGLRFKDQANFNRAMLGKNYGFSNDDISGMHHPWNRLNHTHHLMDGAVLSQLDLCAFSHQRDINNMELSGNPGCSGSGRCKDYRKYTIELEPFGRPRWMALH